MPIVERLAGALAYHGRNTGKKIKALRIIKHAFEIIALLTGRNPIDVFVGAVMNAGPREDSTRIGTAGVVRKQAVDVSPLRRVNVALYYMCRGARDHSMKNMKTISEYLADEIMNCEKNNP